MKKIKNWQFNLLADDKDKWPTEPRFNPLLHSTMISDTPDNGARPHFTKSKAVFEEEQRDDLIDLNNNSINKTEATKPKPQRKAKFGHFENTFEEEEEVPNLPKCIQWDRFMKPFTNNSKAWQKLDEDYGKAFGVPSCVNFEDEQRSHRALFTTQNLETTCIQPMQSIK